MAVLKGGALTGDDLKAYQDAQAEMWRRQGTAATVVNQSPQGTASASRALTPSYGGSSGSYAGYSSGGGAGYGPVSVSTMPYTSYSATPLTINSQRDPNIEQTYGDVRRYREDLAGGTDRDAVNAIMRQRDVVSGLAKEIGQERALATGGVDSGAANQAATDVYSQGGRDISSLNAQLAAGGRQAQLAALGAQGSVASAGAADLAQKNNFALNTWEAQQSAEQARVKAINDAQQAQWSANLQLAALAFTG